MSKHNGTITFDNDCGDYVVTVDGFLVDYFETKEAAEKALKNEIATREREVEIKNKVAKILKKEGWK